MSNPNDPNYQDPVSEDYDPRGYNFGGDQPQTPDRLEDFHKPGAQTGPHVGADVEDVYMGTSQDLEDRIRLRASMSRTIKPPTPTWVKLMVVFVLIVAGTAAYLAFTKVETIDEEGIAITMSKGAWLKRLVGMSDRQRLLLDMSPEFRGFYLTRERVFFVKAVVAEHYMKMNELPKLAALVESGKLPAVQAKDGWGNEFRIESTGRSWRVYSLGQDALAGSKDDISLKEDEGKLVVPSIYQGMELEYEQKQKKY